MVYHGGLACNNMNHWIYCMIFNEKISGKYLRNYEGVPVGSHTHGGMACEKNMNHGGTMGQPLTAEVA